MAPFDSYLTVTYTDVVVVADEAAQLLYAYLDLFWYARKYPNYRSSTAFVLSDRLQKVFRVLHAAFIARRMDQLDPFLLSQYGSSMSAWAESRWLYWMSDERRIERGREQQLRIWLVSERELAHVHPAGHSALVKVGRNREDKWRVPRGVENLHIDGSPWTLHSNESSLARAVATLSEVAEVMLFHNSPQSSKRFLQRYTLRGLVLPKNPYIL